MNAHFSLPNDKPLRDDNPLQPYEIVSLWEVLDFYADKFANISRMMSELCMVPLSESPKWELSQPILDQLLWLKGVAEELSLRGLVVAIERLFRDLDQVNTVGNKQVKRDAHAVLQRIIDDFNGQLILAVTSSRAHYYDLKETFLDAEIVHKLSDVPCLVEEATNAGNCFALGNDTACVFHLMRVMEHCLQKLAERLGLTLAATYDKTWQGIINDIRGNIKSKWPKEKDPIRIKHEELLGHLETIKIRWRNQTMHPKATYNEKETQKVLAAVEAFIEAFADL
jgi:hypothetical protein